MQEYYTTGEAAAILEVTTKTMRNWDKEDTFVPVRRDGEDRFYSRQQIEEKLGKTIEEAVDPVAHLDQKGIEALMWLVKENIHLYDFNTMEGDTIRERYQSLYMAVIQRSTAIYRKNGVSAANWILASPEMASWFETCTAAFYPVPYKEEKCDVKYLGIVNSRWRIYSSPLLDPDTILLGVKIGHELMRSPDSLAAIKLSNWIM